MFCPGCGVQVERPTKFCKACGLALSDHARILANPEEFAQEQKEKQKKRSWLSHGALYLGIGYGLVTLYWLLSVLTVYPNLTLNADKQLIRLLLTVGLPITLLLGILGLRMLGKGSAKREKRDGVARAAAAADSGSAGKTTDRLAEQYDAQALPEARVAVNAISVTEDTTRELQAAANNSGKIG